VIRWLGKINLPIFSSLNIKNYLSYLLVFWTIIVLHPILDSAFVSDDAYNSMIRGTIIYNDETIWNRTFSEITGWATGSGRLNPLNWLFWYPFFYYVTSLLAFKVLTTSFVCISVFLFYKIIHRLTNNKEFGYICAFFVPIFFQFRFWHDPFLAFAPVPLTCMLLFASIFFMIKYLDEKKSSFFVSFCLLYLTALLSYEVSYMFLFLCIPILFFHDNKNGSLKCFLMIILLLFLHIFFRIYFLIDDSNVYPGHKLHLDIDSILQALYLQLISAFPMSWKLAKVSLGHTMFHSLNFITITAYLLFSVVFSKVLMKFDKQGLSKRTLYTILIFASMLFVFPAIGLAVSGHQKELIIAGIGYGYIFSFYQYFGLCILILYFLVFLKEKFPNRNKIIQLALIPTIFFVGFVTHQENLAIVEATNKELKRPRVLLEKAIESGLLKDVREKDLIVRYEKFPSDHYWFLTLAAKKKIHTCNISNPPEFPNCFREIAPNKYADVVHLRGYNKIRDKDSKLFALTHFSDKDESGSVFLAEISSILLDAEAPLEMIFSNYKLYDLSTNKIHSSTSQEYYDFLKIDRGSRNSKVNIYEMKNYLSEKLIMGFREFHSEEGNREKNYLRWSSGDSTMIVFNKTKSLINANIVLDLYRPVTKNTNAIPIRIVGNNINTDYMVKVEKKLNLKMIFEPGPNYIKFQSKSPPIDNGDPRNIVFGIRNYKLEHIMNN